MDVAGGGGRQARRAAELGAGFLGKSTCPQSHVYLKLLNSIVSDAITETKVRCRRQSPEPKDSGD